MGYSFRPFFGIINNRYPTDKLLQFTDSYTFIFFNNYETQSY